MTGDKLSGVPNTPGTPRRSIRVGPIWDEAMALAKEIDGVDLSTVIREDLERHVQEWRAEKKRRKGKGKT